MTAQLSAPAALDRSRGSARALGAARVLLALLGAVTVGGATYFSFVATPEQGGVSGPVDVAFGVWAVTMGAAFVVTAVRLGRRPSTRAIGAAAGLVAVHVVFSLIKLVGYAETEVVVLLAVDAVILALLAVNRRPARLRA